MLIGYVRVSKSDGSQTLASRLRRCSRQWQLLRFVNYANGYANFANTAQTAGFRRADVDIC